MMRSLFAGVSGLRNHQTRMDVIGNNIANVNTIGFKKSRVTFQDLLSQTMRGASSPQAGRAGTNPMQVGLGMSLASIDVIHTGGSPQSTGVNTDLAIDGEGFFVVGIGDDIYYTRAGNFDFDQSKTFYNTSNGMVVKGYMADENGVIDASGAGKLVDINLSSLMTAPPKATSETIFNKNLDQRAEPLTGVLTGVVHNSGTATPDINLNAVKLPITGVKITQGATTLTEGPAGTGHYEVNYLTGEVTIHAGTADGPYDIEYTMPNHSSPITVYDSSGDIHELMVYYTKTGDNTWQINSSITTTDPLGNTVVNFGTGGNGSGEIVFDKTTGRPNPALTTISDATISIAGVQNLEIKLNFSGLTEYAGDSTAIGFHQDGYKAGDLDSLSIDTTGTITGNFSNGQNRALAQIAIATFANPSGLLKEGNNLFRPSNNSGIPDTGIPGVGGRGMINPERLEMSNVDLSQEFVDMIITQRGFQANSRVITTSDQILEELVNLRR
ncbi:MAG: flagellar hook protein FlgE [Clostridia bacterium]|jgi:flagellar hook protein FlgE|nr:flagellar hook protein FlgE [Clostridia bacterium]